MKNLCIHPGIYPKTATASSFVIEYLSGGILIWFTNSPFPCVSLYKPAILKDGKFYSLWRPFPMGAEQIEASYAYWQARRKWAIDSHKLALSSQEEFKRSRDEAQRSILAIGRQAYSSIIKEKASPERVLSMYANEVAAAVTEWENRWNG